jgi:riboflavin kinase/FMN adenylyltransferase
MPVLYRHMDDLPERFRGGALSIGNFDGVHLGHARIVARLLAMARRQGVSAVILTFDPHPAFLLRPQQAPTPLSWTERKARLLHELGVEAVVAYPTDAALLRLTADEFFARIVLGQLRARGMVEGRNFFFGHDRGGNIRVLGDFCRRADIPLEVVESVQVDGQVVSSSRVRTLISAGEVAEAVRLLSRPYRIRGTVVHGQGRGNRLGYPTANVGEIDTLLPGEGIYAGRAWLDGRPHATAMSLGGNPTFDETEKKVEAFLLDYRGDLYGRPIEIDFLARLRDIRRFDSPDQLVDQMALDVQETRRIAGPLANQP